MSEDLVVDVAHAALLEVGRSDLAELVCGYVDADGSLYLEPLDEVVGADLALMERAWSLALSAAGLPS